MMIGWILAVVVVAVMVAENVYYQRQVAKGE